jgi:hypothetical protein
MVFKNKSPRIGLPLLKIPIKKATLERDSLLKNKAFSTSFVWDQAKMKSPSGRTPLKQYEADA